MSEGRVLILLILIYKWSMALWKIYLYHRQLVRYRNSTEIPHEISDSVDFETFERTRLYHLHQTNVRLIRKCYTVLLATIMIMIKSRRYCWSLAKDLLNIFGLHQNTLHISIVFMFLMNAFKELQSLPFKAYSAFYLEKIHDRKKVTAGSFLVGRLKSLVLLKREKRTGRVATLVMILIAILVYIADWSFNDLVNYTTSTVVEDYSYLNEYIWIGVFMGMVVSAAHKFYIFPKFQDYPPFPEGELKSQLETLARRVDFPARNLHVLRTNRKFDARVTGFFDSAKILFFIPILHLDDSNDSEGKQLTDNEVLGILGHELGHWKLNHLLTTAVFYVIDNTLFVSSVIFFIDKKSLYGAFGFQKKQPLIVGFRIVSYHVYPFCQTLLRICSNLIRRKEEFEADKFAATLGLGVYLQTALVKLHTNSLNLAEQDWLYAVWYFAYPSLSERLRELKKYE